MRAVASALSLSLVASAACHLVLPHDPQPPPGVHRDGAGDLREDGRRLDGALDLHREGGARDRACIVRWLALVADGDDGEIEGGTDWLPAGEKPEQEPFGIYLGYWYDAPTWGYFRFTLSEPLTRVERARLVLQGSYATPGWDESRDALLVGLEDSADAATVTSAGQAPDKSQGRHLVGTLRWPAARGLEWRSGGAHASVDLAPLLNQLAKQRGALAKGAHLQLWLRGERSQGAAEVLTPARELDPHGAARLELCY